MHRLEMHGLIWLPLYHSYIDYWSTYSYTYELSGKNVKKYYNYLQKYCTMYKLILLHRVFACQYFQYHMHVVTQTEFLTIKLICIHSNLI